MLTHEELLKRLREDKYILTSDVHNCACSGKLTDLPAIQNLIRDLEAK